LPASPGVARPVGDRYAVSIVPVATLLLAEHRSTVEELLRKVTVWVCDRYEQHELGLASVEAPASEKVARLLGGPFEHVTLDARRESQVANVLLDVAATVRPTPTTP
jgi:hypothetical protein